MKMKTENEKLFESMQRYEEALREEARVRKVGGIKPFCLEGSLNIYYSNTEIYGS